MDHLVVAVLLALTMGLGAACWYALAAPDVLLSLWQRGDEGWADEEEAPVQALQWTLCALLAALAFASGFALLFLSSV